MFDDLHGLIVTAGASRADSPEFDSRLGQVKAGRVCL